MRSSCVVYETLCTRKNLIKIRRRVNDKTCFVNDKVVFLSSREYL